MDTGITNITKEDSSSRDSATTIVVIANNCTSDVHICGRCKTQFTVLDNFLEHKMLGCCPSAPNGSKEEKSENILQNVVPSAEKFNSTLHTLNSSKEISMVESQEDRRGSFLPVEQDVATLLANQLSGHEAKSDAGGTLASDDNFEFHDNDNKETLRRNIDFAGAFVSAELGMQLNNSEENGVFYRGKMRSFFRCDVSGCNYKSHMRKDIDRHKRIHTGERPFKCYLCGKTFTRGDKLLIHQRIHSGDKRHKCSYCNYAAVDSGSLNKHIRIHNGERPYKCQLCSYCANTASQLTVHLRSHTGDSPFICSHDKCKAAFKTHTDLKRHLAVHSPMKPHSCSYCPYKSTLKSGLQCHIQNHHPNGELNEYRCNDCTNMVFPTVRKLRIHVKKHHIIEVNCNNKTKRKVKRSSLKTDLAHLTKTYTCQQCDASFVCVKSLQTHERFHAKMAQDCTKHQFKPCEKTFTTISSNERTVSQSLKQDSLLEMEKRDPYLLAREIELLDQVTLTGTLQSPEMFSSRLTLNSPAMLLEDLHAPPVAIT